MIFRRHLRAWATAWLVVQVGWVSAFVPRDCCAAHQPATTRSKHSCHESTAASPCPMAAAGGTPCPMHRSQSEPGEHHHASTKAGPKPNECALRGTCAGPMTALLSLLSNHGILPEPVTTISSAEQASAFASVRENVIGHFESPDPPPPRA